MVELEEKMNRSGKYLSFKLEREEYGIGILKVKEIIGMMSVTPLPRTPEFVKGMINLRGKVIPVMDLKVKFGMEPADHTNRTCIVVIEAQSSTMAACWDVKQCNKPECPAYGNRDLRCWMISGTFCRNETQGSFYEKIEACRECEIYRPAEERRHVFSMGVVVDSVSEVVNIKEEDIEDTPAFGNKLDTGYILGIAKVNNRVKILLDIDKVLSSEEMAVMAKAA